MALHCNNCFKTVLYAGNFRIVKQHDKNFLTCCQRYLCKMQANFLVNKMQANLVR